MAAIVSNVRKLLVPITQFRDGTFDRESINEEERTIELSVSSDAPYERWWGIEILDHQKKSIDFSRIDGSAPLLFNHDRGLVLGRILEASTDGKKMTVKAKISPSAFAEEKWAEIKAGILREASIGYSIKELVLEKQEKGKPDTYRAKSWTPYEASIVTIPADISVGIGRHRSQNDEATTEFLIDLKESSDTREKDMDDPATLEVKEKEISGKVLAAERKRVSDIQEFMKTLKANRGIDCSEVAAKHIRDGSSFDDFSREVVTTSFKEVTPVETKPEIGMSKRDVRQFSVLRAIHQIISKGRLDGLEKEACDAAAAQLRRDTLDVPNPQAVKFVLPHEITSMDARAYLRDQEVLAMRAQLAGVASQGGFTVDTVMGPLIEYLRNKTVLGRLGITILDGLVGNMAFPVQTGGATAYWVSETGSLTDSEASFGQKSLTPHRLGATIPMSTQFIAQTSLSAEMFARNEIMTVLGLAKDLAGLEGTGASGQPTGVKNTSGINSTVTFGGGPVWADMVEFETGINVDNADIGTAKFALSSSTVGKWKTVLKDSVAGADYLINSNNGLINGYGYERTNQITGNIAFFGIWNQLIMASWAGQEVIVDPYTLKKSGQIEITVNELVDFLVRQPLAFNLSTDSAAQ